MADGGAVSDGGWSSSDQQEAPTPTVVVMGGNGGGGNEKWEVGEKMARVFESERRESCVVFMTMHVGLFC